VSNIPLSGLTYPNRGARVLLLGLEDLLGHHGLVALLKLATLEHWMVNLPPDNLDREVDFSQLTALTQGLLALYGLRSGSGLARQAVRSTFIEAWENQGALAGFKDPQFKELPMERRLEIGAMGATRVFNELTDFGIHFHLGSEGASFEFANCPYCIDVHADSPICGGSVGWVEGLLTLIELQDDYSVKETSCSAVSGRCCTFLVTPHRVE
jgi:hypothetical protein